MDLTGFSELTPVEQVQVEVLRDLLIDRYANARPALMRARLNDREVSVIVAVTREDDDHIATHPMAVMVDGDLFADLVPPGEPEIIRGIA